MNNKITKIIDKNNAKARAKVSTMLFNFFFPNVRQAKGQNHNDEIYYLFQNFRIDCHVFFD